MPLTVQPKDIDQLLYNIITNYQFQKPMINLLDLFLPTYKLRRLQINNKIFKLTIDFSDPKLPVVHPFIQALRKPGPTQIVPFQAVVP